ncbi:HEAT repeat domain-containing protein [Nakamurella sp. YIM 132087]|uniref:HEAT repeat domain-containing protein n=1 Tax=Nakamurella alba TaxID=2665158 RepID=A0A7K1FKL1_9ACTN|nr:HEAT repeat domain-containing protein [Nakamurella alba]MTD13404.1 HEAT repeat domain-containing protein [Nakamurella alba]
MSDRTQETALHHGDPSVRLRAALAIGTVADPSAAGELLARCAVEPDFQVREMLTWALTRLPADVTLPGLLTALRSPTSQERSQALHTFGKIGDRRAWPAITKELLTDPDDAVATAAWRTAVLLVPDDGRSALATILGGRLGRGELSTRRSLSRALVVLGEDADAAIDLALTDQDPAVREHAAATRALHRDPESGFAVSEAQRVHLTGGG